MTGCVDPLFTKSHMQSQQIISNNNSSYIVFSRPGDKGEPLFNTIVEFTPNVEGMTLVGTLGPNTKLIHEVPAGEHHFYMQGGLNDDIIKIQTSPGKIYYVHTQVNPGLVGRFNFVPFRYSTKMLKKSLAGKACDQEFLHKYGFDLEEKEYHIKPHGFHTSNAMDLEIQCKNQRIVKVAYSWPSLELLEGSQLVKTNKHTDTFLKKVYADYQHEINQDYPGWSKKGYGNDSMNVEDGVPIDEIYR
ncbi:MAG: hypothetical protein ABW092_03125 [Candidatus Thiodiazotropha sp.]